MCMVALGWIVVWGAGDPTMVVAVFRLGLITIQIRYHIGDDGEAYSNTSWTINSEKTSGSSMTG
jgi:hypothetical protein